MKSGLHVGGIMCKVPVEEQDVSDVKVRRCNAAESRDHSMMTTGDKATGISSFRTGDSSSSQCAMEFCNPVYLKQASKYSLIYKVTQSSPSPVLSFVERVPQDTQTSHITAVDSEHGESTSSKTIRDVHISIRLMEDFLELARENTKKDLETCGILGALLEKGTFYMTTLIIPKQESTSNSCQATNEEEVFAILNERSLFPVGWIHTHPSQNCFMSSVDLHTQYSYQVMVPEAFAIVLAPNDTSRSCGLFRITDPDGMSILKGCPEKGFHLHKEPDDGSPMYEHCSNVYKNSNLRFEIFDLR